MDPKPVSNKTFNFRFNRHPGLQCRRDGELGSDHVPRDFTSLFRISDFGHRKAVDRRSNRPRARTPVVRQSRHHEMVERHLAQ